ncbi:MAG TPA: PKD domain-containing protein [Vicinamibacterales bacterium]|nr:PKD domain-containing protein [Vicinamibacterales bacterium]
MSLPARFSSPRLAAAWRLLPVTAFGVVVALAHVAAENAPTAVITAPATVAYGQAIVVSGANSVAASGRHVREYIWRFDGGNPIQTDVPTFTFPFDPAHPFAVGPHEVELVVGDDFGDRSAPEVRSVTVRDTVAPTAVVDAPAAVGFGVSVTASGQQSSDVGGEIAAYEWQLDGGPPIVTPVPSVTFTATLANPLAIGVHVVRLVVTDDSGNQSAPDSATFLVRDTLAPTAVLSAPALVPFGSDITVSGQQSADVGGQLSEYRWSLDGGPPIVTDTPSFTFVAAPASPLSIGTHLVQLVVVDDSGNQSAAASRQVRVVDAQVPTAILDAPATVSVGQGFTASGARSVDFDGEIVEYIWRLDARPPVAIDQPAFTVAVDPANPLLPGLHTVQLVVRDDSGNESDPASATVRVVDDFAPTAIIDAPDLVPFGADIEVSGGRSVDIGGRITQYIWRLDGGVPIALDVPAKTFALNPAAPFSPGPHVVELVVVDDSGNQSDPSTATVRVADGVAPTAVLDVPATVPFGENVEVSGARSADVGGRLVLYRWSLDDGPEIETADPGHTFVVAPAQPLTLGRHRVRLVVGDDSGNQSVADEAEFIVVDSVAPTAIITAPPTLVVGEPLAVSGERSFDVGGRVHRYVWRLDGGDPIAQDLPTQTFGAAPAPPLALGTHLVELVVTDDSGNQSEPATARVEVVEPPDTEPPTVTIASPSDDAAYLVNTVVVASYSCEDAASGGLASCSGPVADGSPLDTSSVGTKQFTVTASDRAGNQTTATHTYRVVYGFAGFFAPVDNLPVVNTGAAGRTFPVKWRLATAGGTPVTALSSVASITDAAVACDASPADALEEQLLSAPGEALHYDAAADQFVYNWKTAKGATGCRLLQVTLADGTKHFARFRLR